ncbi:hypothetical protein KBB60_00230 [Patescibacteria group bacterium]|nr:hypothetical protein [Patescibacteria group bacterium]
MGCCILVLLTIAFVIFKRGKRSVSSNLLLFSIFSAVLWLITNLVANISLHWGSEQYLFWTRLTLVGPILLLPSMILFANAFPADKITISKPQLFLLAVISVVLLFFVPSHYNVESVNIVDAGKMISSFKPGPLYVFFIGYFVFCFLLMVIFLLRKYYLLTKKEKPQILSVIFGMLLSLMAGVLFSAVMPLSGNYSLINISPVSVLFFIIFTGYAIAKHQLLSVQLIVTETVTYLAVIALLVDAIFSRTAFEVTVKLIFLPVLVYGGHVLIKSMKQEIEHRHKLEELFNQLQRANQQLLEVDQRKTEFISMASHELLTPISAIEGYLSMIVEEKIVPVGNPKAEKYLQSVYKSSNRLARLVADLLNVSRIEEGRLLVEKKAVSVLEMLQSTVDELKFKAQTSHIKISYTSQVSGQEALAYADSDKIKEVLVNLTGNALKFNKPGGAVRLWAQAWPTQAVQQRYNQMARFVVDKPEHGDGALRRVVNQSYTQMVGDKQIVIAVADNGVGISCEDIGKLFQKFSRVGDWSTQEVQGTGLGLYVSKAIVEMHHGKIWVESPGEGKGSVFYFSLPLAQYSTAIAQLDARVPHNQNMKGLARMGGGPAAK